MLNSVSKSQLQQKQSILKTLASKINPNINCHEVVISLNALSKMSDLNQSDIKSAIICLVSMINSELVMKAAKKRKGC